MEGYEVQVQTKVPVVMRDGAVLLTDLYLPRSALPVPAVLYRTPYNASTSVFARTAFELARRGMATVLQNCRGRYGSDGEFIPFQNEGNDASDTSEWLAQQPWFDGSLGLLGVSYASYAAAVSLKNGMADRVNVRCMVSLGGILNPYAAVYLSPGVFTLHWGLPFLSIIAGSRQRPTSFNWDEEFRQFPRADSIGMAGPALHAFFNRTLSEPKPGAFWQMLSTVGPEVAAVPTLHVTGWYDFLLPLALSDFQVLHAEFGAKYHRLLVGPWDHKTLFLALARSLLSGVQVPGADKYETLRDGGRDLLRDIIDWFQRWLLKAPPTSHDAPVTVFVTGDERWQETDSWPSAGLQTGTRFLSAATTARSRRGDGALTTGPSQYTGSVDHNPLDPVPTVGGAVWPIHNLEPGPADQSSVEDRPDVLVFTGAQFRERFTILGPVSAVLWLDATVSTFDVAIKLVDVDENGCTRILSDGIRRVENHTPGVRRPVQVELAGIGHTFLPGHALRLEVATANFPKYATLHTPYRLDVASGVQNESQITFWYMETES